MRYRKLGKTDLLVSEIAFGAGPVAGLMTDGSGEDRRAVVAAAVNAGVNWFDTAAGYGAGRSEANLGETLATLPHREHLHIATKVRLMVKEDTDLRPLVRDSFLQSLLRLRVSRVTLLQVHNSITARRNDEPTSLTPEDILGPHGVLSAFEDLRAEGLVDHFGLTGIGNPEALRQVMNCRRFETIQAPFHLLNPSSLVDAPWTFREPDYAGFLRHARELEMGMFAIRAYAAGALLCAPPSRHTLSTPFFPLALYERDCARARQLANILGSVNLVRELALRYVLTQNEFSAAILGFGHVAHIEEAVRISDLGSLSDEEMKQLSGSLAQLL